MRIAAGQRAEFDLARGSNAAALVLESRATVDRSRELGDPERVLLDAHGKRVSIHAETARMLA